MKPPILLRIYINDSLEGVRQFDQKQIVIGREADVQLDLKDAAVSPLHAVIEERETGYYILDLGSQTGTLRNGQRILDDRLESGDEIKIGPYKIQFFVGVPKPAAPPSKDKPKPSLPVEPPPMEKTMTNVAIPKPSAPKPPRPMETPRPAPRPTIPSGPPSSSAFKKHKKKGEKTFAPPSSFNDARDIVRPSKGTVVEVLVAWKERIIAARNFTEKGVITVGADPTCDLVVPLFGGGSKFPLVKLQSMATVCLTQDMSGELIRDQGPVAFSDLLKQNKLRNTGSFFELDVPQGEMVRIAFQGGLLSVFVRYVPETPKPMVAPLLDLTASEVTGVILAFVVSAIFGLYMMIYAPSDLADEARLEEPIRKAIVTFKVPKKEIVQVEEKPPEEKKVVKIVEKQKQTQTPSADQQGKPGRAAEVAPKPPTKDKTPKLTSAKSGGAIKTAPKEGASAQSQKPDPTKVGLLGVFGSKGTQSKLDKTFSGAGDLTGMANQATGFAGNAENRAGDQMGSKLKDTGPGGKGTATVGIAGVGTKGKGTGSYGLGTGGIGTKGSVDIDVGGQEAEITGSIDKEAIRRIIQQNKNAIRSCYERSLQRKPDLYGKLVLEWDIEDRGRVTRTSVKSNSLGDDQVANCIMGRIKDLKFPEPPPDQIGRVTFPFVFSSQ
ncbi:MAG: AgmX/PglI C-terminal domain-containing protein [Bdellovibrionales bacterium]